MVSSPIYYFSPIFFLSLLVWLLVPYLSGFVSYLLFFSYFFLSLFVWLLVPYLSGFVSYLLFFSYLFSFFIGLAVSSLF